VLGNLDERVKMQLGLRVKDLLARGGVGVQLEGEGGVGGEGVGVEVREALGDVLGRQSQP